MMSSKFLNFIQNINRYHADQLCIFQIGLTKRYANILIMPKCGTQYNRIHTLSNPRKVFFTRKIGKQDWRWTCMRFTSDESKIKQEKLDKKLADDVQQKIIELNQEKLGKLKERVLNVESISADNKEEAQSEAADIIEKDSEQPKQPLIDDTTSKKGMIFIFSEFYSVIIIPDTNNFQSKRKSE